MSTLRIVSWNVLAAPWAAPAFYPDGMDPALLDRDRRADVVADRLLELDGDVVCLQEVTPVDLARMLVRLGDRYDHHHVGNGRELWASWSTAEVPWEPNGTAVLWKHGELAVDHRGRCDLSDDGNVATTVELTHRYGARVRVTSVHLDVDDAALRRRQLSVALERWDAGDGRVEVIAGDCNEDTRSEDLAEMLGAHGFVDALTEVGATEPTHPYARPGDAWEVLARIDHLIVRGATPGSARVHDFGTWALETPGDRIAELLRTAGSDHLPVTAGVTLPG